MLVMTVGKNPWDYGQSLRASVQVCNLHISARRVTRWHGTSCSATRRSSLDRSLPLADNP